MFSKNPYEWDDEPAGEPDHDTCDFGVSADCTEEPEFFLPSGLCICGPCRRLMALESITMPVQRSA